MGWFSSVKTFKGINKQVWAEYMLIFLCVPKLASGRGWDMDFCPTLKMLRHIQGEQSDLHISCNCNFLSPLIFFPNPKVLKFFSIIRYWTEWEQEPQFVKLFLLAHKLRKQMEGFFLWLQIERSPLTTNKYGNVAACCFTAEEWSMQKALGESEPSNKSIVPVLVWIPKKFKLWKSILKSLQEIYFFFHLQQLCKSSLTLLMQMFWKSLYLEETR